MIRKTKPAIQLKSEFAGSLLENIASGRTSKPTVKQNVQFQSNFKNNGPELA